ncbi:MAG: PKD domain-containing protein [Bacteroidota bacterium]
MKRIISLIFLFFLLIGAVQSQTYLMNAASNGTTVTTCTGSLYDPGGASGGYGNNQNFVITLCSNNALTTHIKLYFSAFSIHASDTLFIYDGNNTSAPLIGAYNASNTLFLFPVYATASNASGCLTLRFKSDAALSDAGFEAQISCVTACQTVLSSIDSAAMYPQMKDSNNVDICLGDTVTFIGNGVFPQNNLIYNQSNATSVFQWDFGDGTTAIGQTVKHFYPIMRGYNVDLRVTDNHGCVSMNSMGTRVRISTDPIGHVGSLPDICTDSKLNVSVGFAYNNSISVTVPSFYQQASLAYDSATFIPDGGALGGMCYNTNVNFSCFQPGQVVTNANDIVSVEVSMEHSFIGDLEMKLICPTGQSTTLKTYVQSGGAYLGEPFGGNGHSAFDCTTPPSCITDPLQNPMGTCWRYEWTMLNPSWNVMQTYAGAGNISTPYTMLDSGSYTPDNSFASMIGCPLNGTWNLQICDYWAIDNGWVCWWRLNLDPSILPINWGYSVPIDTVTWSGPSIIYNTGKHIIIKPDSAGIFDYHVFIKDDFGCTYDTIIPLTVVQTPQPDLGPDSSMCEGSPYALIAPNYPNSSYYWLPGGQTIPTITPSESGKYVVIIQTGNGNVQCVGYDTINVNFYPKPLISFLPDIFEGCNPIEVNFKNITIPLNASYHWDFGDGDTSNLKEPSHIYKTTGTYNVSLAVATGSGCNDSYTISGLIKVYPQPVAGFQMSAGTVRVSDPTVTFTNTSADATNYAWNFGDGAMSAEANPSHTWPAKGYFQVIMIAFTDHGCADTTKNVVNVIDDDIVIPNIITPNGDGKNDFFVIDNLDSYTTNELTIFDRWGKKIYQKDNYQNDWGGDGHPDGTYYWILRTRGSLKSIATKGTLTIIGSTK